MICHGQPTFRGTRAVVADVLDQVARSMAWETVVAQWHCSVSPEAIAEVVSLAGQTLLDHAEEYTLLPATA